MAGANPAMWETSGTAGVMVRNVPTSCSPRLLLVHEMAGCTGSLEVRCASALCSPCASGSSNETVVSMGGVPQLSVLLISLYLEAVNPYLPAEKSNPAGRNIPSESLSRAPILVGLPGSLGNRCQHLSVLGS